MYTDLKIEREETLKSQYMNTNPNEIGQLIDTLHKHFLKLTEEDSNIT